MRKLLYVILALAIVLIGLEVYLFQYITTLTQPGKKQETVDPKDLLLPANDLLFHSVDGSDLRGWLIQGKPDFPAVIIAPDQDSNRSETLANLEGLITTLNKAGYWVLLFDFRGHGESNSPSTLGYRESEDLEAAVKAVLRYKQIGRRIAVLGVGMGAVAATQALQTVDEVKCFVFDSLYGDIPAKVTDDLIKQWPLAQYIRPAILRVNQVNLRYIVKVPTTDLDMARKIRMLYPRAIVFVEKKPLRPGIKMLYDAAKEPKELLELNEAGIGELMGNDREKYNSQIGEKIQKYLPAVAHEKTIDLSK